MLWTLNLTITVMVTVLWLLNNDINVEQWRNEHHVDMMFRTRKTSHFEMLSEHDDRCRKFPFREREIIIRSFIDHIDDSTEYVKRLFNFAEHRLLYDVHPTSGVAFIITDSKGCSLHFPLKL